MNNFKYCGNCGKKIRSNTKFCPYCGAKQSNDVQMNTQPTYKMPTRHRKWINSGKHKLMLLVIIIIILILGVVGYQHSEASINLNREIPNNTWIFRGNDNGSIGKVNDVHFKSHHMSGNSLNNVIKQRDMNSMTIKPTGHHTANFVTYYPNGDYAATLMKVTNGNEKSFTLSSIKKVHVRVNSRNGTITDKYWYINGKKIHPTNSNDKKRLAALTIKLTKE